MGLAILLLVAILYMYPFYYLLECSIKPAKDFYVPLKLPSQIFWGNYQLVFAKAHVFEAFTNTILVCAGTMLLLVAVSSMAGYMITRRSERFYKVPPRVIYDHEIVFMLSGKFIHYLDGIRYEQQAGAFFSCVRM